VTYDRPWDRLIEYLNEWASSRELPGGIEVTFTQSDGAVRTVEVVVTSDEWDDYVSTIYGTDDPRATTLRGSLLAMPDQVPYLVYDTYDWLPSPTRELPEDDFDPGPGEWVVTDSDGTVHRFADFEEQN
jgi:hypothetical protein